MSQKIIVGLLVLTVAGAIGVGVYDAVQPASAGDEAFTSANVVAADTALAQAPTAQPPVQGYGQGAGDGTGPVSLQQQEFTENIGEAWTGSGIITGFDPAGMSLTLDDGAEAYVELGPSFYWQSQSVALNVGDRVSVTGFFNGDQIHAATVTRADSAVLRVRTDEGQPLWSVGNQGSETGNGSGPAQTGVQVAPEDWITLTGVVTAVNNSSLTVQTDTGDAITLSLGRADFWQGQGVTFAPGDAVSVLGLWQGTQFRPGEITKTATGERLMLLDPNGRPLWGGPGRAGSAGQGSAQGQQGQGGQGNGGGRGYRGGRQG